MAAASAIQGRGKAATLAADRIATCSCVSVTLYDELIAAAEGWRRAHGLSDQSDALGELIRLGLMSEIARIFRLVSPDKPEPSPDRARKATRRAARREPAAQAPSPNL